MQSPAATAGKVTVGLLPLTVLFAAPPTNEMAIYYHGSTPPLPYNHVITVMARFRALVRSTAQCLAEIIYPAGYAKVINKTAYSIVIN